MSRVYAAQAFRSACGFLPSLLGGKGFKKKKKNTLAGRMLAPYRICIPIVTTLSVLKSFGSRFRISDSPFEAFRQRYGALALLYWLRAFPSPQKKKRGGKKKKKKSWEEKNCLSTHATTATPPLGWLRPRLLLLRCRAHLADRDELSILSALGRFFAWLVTTSRNRD